MARKAEEGAPALLFERLVDLEPTAASEARPFRTLDRAGLRASVRREVERLVNTRASLPEEALERRPRTVIDYGIPDFSTFTTSSGWDKYRLSEMLRRTIEAYEPRLRELRVEVEVSGREEGRLYALIEATIVVGEIVEPVSFPVAIRRRADEPAGLDAEAEQEAEDAG